MSEPRKLINTKGDVETACRLDPRGERDYLAYAAHNLKGAMDKREDAPCSAAEHEMAARVALNMERVPTYPEIVEAWKTHGDPSVPLSAIRALVQQWRTLADALTKGHTTADEHGHADGLLEAADDLAALCPAPPEDQVDA